MTGLRPLLAMAVRRDRRAVLLTVAGTAALVLLSAASLHDLYPTAADRARFAAGVGSNPALVAIRGPARALETTGGALSWQVGWFAGVLAAIASILLVGRHARGDEERGRTELVLAGPVARAAPLAAGVAVAAATSVLLAAVLALGLIVTGLPAGGALAFGLSAGGLGLVFAGVAAVTAQLAESARAAGGLAAAVLGAAYVLRAAGDTGDGTLSWFSPLGWSQAMRAFAGERWWPLALSLGPPPGCSPSRAPCWRGATTAPGCCDRVRARPPRRPRCAGPRASPCASSAARCSAGAPGSSRSGRPTGRSDATCRTCSTPARRSRTCSPAPAAAA